MKSKFIMASVLIVLVSILYACSNGAATDTVTIESEIITYVESNGNLMAVQLQTPVKPRYVLKNEAPIIVMTPTFFTPTSRFEDDTWAVDSGFVQVSLMLPGKTASGYAGVASEGTNDYGGAASVDALKDVTLFALGEIPDRDGKYITDHIPFASTDNVGMYAFSHPGILATNTLAFYSTELAGVQYFVGRENPTIDKLSSVEVGHWDDYKPAFNVIYKYPAHYSSTDLTVDYTNIQHGEEGIYFDHNEDLTFNTGDFLLGDRVPEMFGKKYYSEDLIAALSTSESVQNDGWPPYLADLTEVQDAWSTRETVDNYGELNSNLKVMLVFAKEDHVQPALDKPHIHQAYDGFTSAGLWVRLNPDANYIQKIVGSATYTDVAANTEPADWADIVDWAHSSDIKGADHASAAAISEMADRVEAGDWSDDL